SVLGMARLPEGGGAALVGRVSSSLGAAKPLPFFIIVIPSPVSAVPVRVDPAVIDPVEAVATKTVNYPEPVSIMDVEVRLTARPSEPRDLEGIDGTQVPFAHPVSYETSR